MENFGDLFLEGGNRFVVGGMTWNREERQRRYAPKPRVGEAHPWSERLKFINHNLVAFIILFGECRNHVVVVKYHSIFPG